MEATSTTAVATRTRWAALDPWAVAAFGLGVALVASVAADDGGWWPESWAWTALVTLGASVVVLLLRERPLGGFDLAFLSGLLAFGAWIALSALWSRSVPSTVDETQRALAYVGSVLLAALIVERRTVGHLLGGVLTAITVIGSYALATRLLPDRIGDFDSSNFGNYRLSEPVTYWNGLGIVLVVGVFLAVGVAARSRALWMRALAGACVPILTPAIYFTFSRGAWIALFVGAISAIALDPRRLQLLAVSLAIAPFAVTAAWLATRADGLRVVGSGLEQATKDGHALLWPLLALAVGSALVAVGMGLAERRLVIPRAVHIAFVGVVVAVAVGLASAAWAEWGSPVAIADRVWDDFRAPGGPGGSEDLGERLFDFSANGRVETWRVAWDEWHANPVLGTGAGTYWQSWAAERPIGLEVRDAHSLYIETLGELGIVGLALLLVALLVPVVAAVRARATAIVPAAFGGYVAWLAHAGVDWDWELLGVTLPALLVGVALVAAARQDHVRSSLPRWLLPAGASLLAVLAVFGVLAYAPLGSARDALNAGRAKDAADDARSAQRFAPWASAPWLVLGDALAEDDPGAARAAYREALEHDGTNWELWFALGAVSTGEEQRRALARAAELNPRSREVAELREVLASSG
jgi:hypothetical protein